MAFYILLVLMNFSFCFCRNQDGYEEFDVFSDEEIEHENKYYHVPTMEERTDLLAGLIPGDHETELGDNSDEIGEDSDEIRDDSDEIGDDSDEIGDDSDELLDEEELTEDDESGGTCYSTPATESSYEEVVEEEIQPQDSDSYYDSDENQNDPTSSFGTTQDSGPDLDTHEGYISQNIMPFFCYSII